MATKELVALAFEKSPRKTDDQHAQLLKRAKEIGMDLTRDTNLFWIADQSLKAKLPEDWVECQTEEGEVYYFNLKDETSVWDHPSLEHYKQLYAKVKQQKSHHSSETKSTLPAIAITNQSSKESFSESSNVSPRSQAANVLKQKNTDKNSGDAYFWRTKYESKEAEVPFNTLHCYNYIIYTFYLSFYYRKKVLKMKLSV
jgi:hypothetical protein